MAGVDKKILEKQFRTIDLLRKNMETSTPPELFFLLELFSGKKKKSLRNIRGTEQLP